MEYSKLYDEVEKLKDYKEIKLIHDLSDMMLCDMKGGLYNTPVMSPEDVKNRLGFLKYEEKEKFIVITCNSVNEIIGIHEITSGLINQVPIHPREAFVEAIKDRAVSVIFAHNHPSGSLDPSTEDMAITKVLCAAGRILQIPVMDHLIISYRGFTNICRQDPSLFEKTFPDKSAMKTN